MNKSKYITITAGNIHLIKFRIKSFIERMETVGMQAFYQDVAKRIKHLDQGNGRRTVDRSRIQYMSSSDFKISLDRSKTWSFRNLTNRDDKLFIRLNYKANTAGQLIWEGTKIRITPTNIFIIEPKLLHKSGDIYLREVWAKGDADMCFNQTKRDKTYADQYWEDYEREQIDELNKSFDLTTQ